METALSLRLRKLLLRSALYLLGLFLVLILLFAVFFVFARPKLLAVGQREMQKYGIEAENIDLSLFGKVRLRNVRIALHDGGSVRIDHLSARPPLQFLGRTWLSGAGTVYDLQLEKGGARIFIPQLSFSGFAMEEKDPAIISHSLQALMRLHLSSLYTDKAEISLIPDDNTENKRLSANFVLPKLQTVINGFSIRGLARGKIAKISYDGMDSQTRLTSAQKTEVSGDTKKSTLQSGAFLAEDIDVASLYTLLRNIIPPAEETPASKISLPQGAHDLAGLINLHNVNILAEGEKFGTVHITATALSSEGFALKGKKMPNFVSQLAVPHSADTHSADKGDEKKRVVLHNISELLTDIASINIGMKNVAIAVEPKPEVLQAMEMAQKAEEERAARAADKLKSVRDILNEEQQREEQRQWNVQGPEIPPLQNEDMPPQPTESLEDDFTHLPLQFKLSLSSFLLKADHWEQAIPHDFMIKIKGLRYIPGKNKNELLQALQKMGHKDLQFSLLGDISWNPQNSELDLKRLAFYSRDMGGFSVMGKFLDVPQSLFSAKPEAMEQALNEAGLAEMEIHAEDNGFIKSLIEWGTTQINISAQELETDLHDIAVKSPPLLLKNHREAKNFSDIFGAFVQNSGTMMITMRAPQEGGLKFRDIMSAQDDLSVLLDKLQLSAERPAELPPLN